MGAYFVSAVFFLGLSIINLFVAFYYDEYDVLYSHFKSQIPHRVTQGAVLSQQLKTRVYIAKLRHLRSNSSIVTHARPTFLSNSLKNSYMSPFLCNATWVIASQYDPRISRDYIGVFIEVNSSCPLPYQSCSK